MTIARSYRDTLRRSALLCGYGILQQGVLLAPTDRSGQLAELLTRPPGGVRLWQSTLGMAPAEAARAAGVAWDLPNLADRYRHHSERLAGRIAGWPVGVRRGQRAGPEAGVAMLRDYVDLLAPALMDTLRDPGLPAILLPADWPAAEFGRSVDEFTATFDPAIRSYLDYLDYLDYLEG